MYYELFRTKRKRFELQRLYLFLIPLLLIFATSSAFSEGVFRLPPATIAEDNKSLASIKKIQVKQFEFVGNTVISDEQLREITDKYLQQLLSIEQLLAIKQKLTKLYINKGFINSGAILADQKIKDGKIIYTIKEGTLSEVKLLGNETINEDYLSAKIFQNGESREGVLNLFKLQKSLKLLEQSPLIEGVDAQLSPGLKPGQSNLSVAVKEAKAYQLSFKMDNHRSPSIGAERGQIEFNHNNLFGSGERLYLNYGILDDKDDYVLNMSIPLNANKTRAGFSIERDSSTVLSEPFNSLGFTSDIRRVMVNLNHRLKHALNEDMSAGIQFSMAESNTKLLGEPFAFPPGVAEARVNELSLYVNWVKRDSQRVFAARSEIGVGLPILTATERDHDLPDGRFIRWNGQFQWLQNLSFWSAESLFRVNMQLSNDNLLSMNQFAAGGANTVRGYRENILVRDNGIVASLEAHIPLIEFNIPGFQQKSFASNLNLVPFLDYGYAWNHDDFLLDPEHIVSIGLGITWKVDKRLSAEIFWGKDLKKVAVENGSNLQDKGIHMQLVLHVL